MALLGETMGHALKVKDALSADKYIDEYVKVMDQISNLKPESKELYGELMGDEPIQSESWNDYLLQRVEAMLTDLNRDRLEVSTPDFKKIYKGWEKP